MNLRCAALRRTAPYKSLNRARPIPAAHAASTPSRNASPLDRSEAARQRGVRSIPGGKAAGHKYLMGDRSHPPWSRIQKRPAVCRFHIHSRRCWRPTRVPGPALKADAALPRRRQRCVLGCPVRIGQASGPIQTGPQLSKRYRSAFSVCMRFSAWSKTADCSPSITSSVISSPR
jgi:hypothetical protein